MQIMLVGWLAGLLSSWLAGLSNEKIENESSISSGIINNDVHVPDDDVHEAAAAAAVVVVVVRC